MHILSFRMSSIKQIWQLIQQGDYAFYIDFKDTSLHVPNVKHHHQVLQFVWQNTPFQPFQEKVLPFRFATASRVFTSLT